VTVFDELLRHPDVREDVELRSRFGFMAFHGGLEGGTEIVAQQAADRAGASLYTVVQPSTLVWHIPSALVRAEHSERLSQFLDHVEVVVAVHGYGRPSRPGEVLLGGGNRALARHLAGHLRTSIDGFEVVDELEAIPPELRGVHPDNPVNRARRGGVQLELPPRVRGASPAPRDRGQPCIPHAGLIDALAAAALTWAYDRPPA
jgi:phage replication-related protein YjqB (UPF0714/DUF867 family)